MPFISYSTSYIHNLNIGCVVWGQVGLCFVMLNDYTPILSNNAVTYMMDICPVTVLLESTCHLPCTQQEDIFSLSHDSCTHYLTIQESINVESYSGCFYCGLFLRLVKRPQVVGWSLNKWLHLP